MQWLLKTAVDTTNRGKSEIHKRAISVLGISTLVIISYPSLLIFFYNGIPFLITIISTFDKVSNTMNG
jgi:hypothetical protein